MQSNQITLDKIPAQLLPLIKDCNFSVAGRAMGTIKDIYLFNGQWRINTDKGQIRIFDIDHAADICIEIQNN